MRHSGFHDLCHNVTCVARAHFRSDSDVLLMEKTYLSSNHSHIAIWMLARLSLSRKYCIYIHGSIYTHLSIHMGKINMGKSRGLAPTSHNVTFSWSPAKPSYHRSLLWRSSLRNPSSRSDQMVFETCKVARWWFQAHFFIFHLEIWGNDPSWLSFLQSDWHHQLSSDDDKIEPPKRVFILDHFFLLNFCKRNEIRKKTTLFLGALLGILQGLWWGLW